MTRSRIRRSLGPGLALLVVLVVAGCTSSPVVDPTSTPTTSSSTPASTGSPSSSTPPTSPSVVTSSSAASTVVQTSTNPWPVDLTPDQITQAQAAIAVYKAYWGLIDRAGAEPGANWTEKVSEYASGPEKATMLTTLAETAARGQRTVGETLIAPVVTDVQPAQIVISDCIDKSHTDFLDSEGVSIKAPDAPGSYIRHPALVQMVQLQDGRWQVVLVTDDWSKTC